MEEFGIGINDRENGTFLPGTINDKNVFKGDDIDKYGNMTPHANVHTDIYYDNVDNMLAAATDKESAIMILADIEEQLCNGTFPY